MRRNCRSDSISERINDPHTSVHEISTISRSDNQTVDKSSCRNQAVLYRHSLPVGAKVGQEFHPSQPHIRVPLKTMQTPPPASNQRSRAVRRFPRGRIRIPTRSSPRITGSTASSRSFARSHATTRASGTGLVGSLRTLASTRYFTTYRSTQSQWPRRSLSADRRATSQWHPRSARPHDG